MTAAMRPSEGRWRRPPGASNRARHFPRRGAAGPDQSSAEVCGWLRDMAHEELEKVKAVLGFDVMARDC